MRNEGLEITPSDWKKTTIGGVLSIGSGKDYKHLDDGDIPVYGTGGYMTSVNEYLYDGESVGIGRKGTIDKPVLLTGKFWTVDTLFYTHSFKSVLPIYVYQLFQTINWKRYNEATGVPSLSKVTIEKIPVIIPPLPEQKKIAEILSTVDEKIDIIDQQIAETEQLKKGLMQRLLTKGIGHTEFKDSPLGKIPKSWEVVKLDSVLNLITYGFTNPMPTVDDGVLMVTATNIKGGRIEVENCRKTSLEAYLQLTNKSRPIKNDVLLTKDGTLGRVAVVGEERICINQSVALLRVNGKMCHLFLSQLLQSDFYQAKMIRDAGGSTIKHIYITRVDKMSVVLPPVSEQTSIVEILGTVDEKRAVLRKKSDAFLRLKRGLMQQLLSGKVRIKINEL